MQILHGRKTGAGYVNEGHTPEQTSPACGSAYTAYAGMTALVKTPAVTFQHADSSSVLTDDATFGRQLTRIHFDIMNRELA